MSRIDVIGQNGNDGLHYEHAEEIEKTETLEEHREVAEEAIRKGFEEKYFIPSHIKFDYDICRYKTKYEGDAFAKLEVQTNNMFAIWKDACFYATRLTSINADCRIGQNGNDGLHYEHAKEIEKTEALEERREVSEKAIRNAQGEIEKIPHRWTVGVFEYLGKDRVKQVGMVYLPERYIRMGVFHAQEPDEPNVIEYSAPRDRVGVKYVYDVTVVFRGVAQIMTSQEGAKILINEMGGLFL